MRYGSQSTSSTILSASRGVVISAVVPNSDRQFVYHPVRFSFVPLDKNSNIPDGSSPRTIWSESFLHGGPSQSVQRSSKGEMENETDNAECEV